MALTACSGGRGKQMIAALLSPRSSFPLLFLCSHPLYLCPATPLQLSLFFAPTTLFTLLLPLSSVHRSPLTAPRLHLVPEVSSPAPHIHIQTPPSSLSPLGARGPGQHQGSLPALRTRFLPRKAGSSGRKSSTADKEPVCQPGTKQLRQAGAWPARVCGGLN